MRFTVAVLAVLALSWAAAPGPGLLAAPPWLGGRPDSTQIERLRPLRDERVAVRLVDGTELHGRATATDSGLVLRVKNDENSLTPNTYDQNVFLPWSKIERLDFDRGGIRYPGVLFFGALFFGLVLLGCFMPKT
ncbi:hypothetical protein LLH00_17660 [bacterium]|nr:hypothetical protein [bacterium]